VRGRTGNRQLNAVQHGIVLTQAYWTYRHKPCSPHASPPGGDLHIA